MGKLGEARMRSLPPVRPDRLAELHLTRRELEVLELVASGATNEKIAARLGISPLTVKKHVERMLAKLDVSNRAALVAAVWRRST